MKFNKINKIIPKYKIQNTKYKKGQALIIGIILLAAVIIFSASVFNRLGGFLRFGTKSVLQDQAVHLAEAGVDKAIWELNKPTATGTYQGEINTPLGSPPIGSFTVQVTSSGTNLKTVKSTGFVPNAQRPLAQKTIEVNLVINTQIVSFNYAVQVVGDVTMENTSTIDGTVYSNGNIIKGVGNNPQFDITGDAYAYGTIDDDLKIAGTRNENQPLSQIPNIDDVLNPAKQAAENGEVIDCSTNPSLCSLTSSTSIGHKKYVGDLTIGGNIIVTVTGPIWVTGNITLSQANTQVKLAESFGSSGTAFISNQTITIGSGASFAPTSATPPGYILVISTSSNNPAILIRNQSATAVFYALNGQAVLEQSASVKALVSKTLLMQNDAELDYESGLASASFTTGPGGSWVPQKGTYGGLNQPPIGIYSGTYFNNSDLTDNKGSDTTFDIQYDWGSGKPKENVDNDTFSVRWEGTFYFNTKTYRFNIAVDDGARLYVDDALLVDNWQNPAIYKSALKSMTFGEHKIKVEYFDDVAGAKIRANWVDKLTCEDITGDAKITQEDLDVIGAAWSGGSFGINYLPYDVNNDGNFTFSDVTKMAAESAANKICS